MASKNKYEASKPKCESQDRKWFVKDAFCEVPVEKYKASNEIGIVPSEKCEKSTASNAFFTRKKGVCCINYGAEDRNADKIHKELNFNHINFSILL